MPFGNFHKTHVTGREKGNLQSFLSEDEECRLNLFKQTLVLKVCTFLCVSMRFLSSIFIPISI